MEQTLEQIITRTNRPSQPAKLVENRICFAGPESELSVYDTYEQASQVSLKADSLLYCGMVTGAKVMHTKRQPNIPFLPHESFILAPKEEVFIDFPEARLDTPTTCLTIEISSERISQLCDRMHDITQSSSIRVPSYTFNAEQPLHTLHNQATEHLLKRLVSGFVQNDPDRDLLVDLGVSELVTRILRHHGRETLLKYCQQDPEANSLSSALYWIESNLSEHLDIYELSKMACMSRSRFYQEFKRHLGCTPAEYQHQRRMATAYQKLRQNHSVTQVSYDLGYQSLSHFSRRFHQHYGIPPSQILSKNLN
ncbi:AraC family transcriptional regulator [Marinomonas balearica]|uniref:AraC-like DNA-binding protein n=1 Tax=Marinomonas balearica TaxID=491947 RepID=A0A4R6MDJ2_9GAMM|nr:helix-turn-helix domain-containing protein [Marinomonas balearica]TDO99466.1 AraC-like DNA-binding protein [Marinomonas balearica]